MSSSGAVYGVEFGPTADQQKRDIPMERRPAFDAAMGRLMKDPRKEPAVQLDDGTWRVRLTQYITMYYAIFQYKMLILAVEITDDKDSAPLYFE